jgi:hypothetical protein
MSGAIPPFPQYAFIGTILLFTFIINNEKLDNTLIGLLFSQCLNFRYNIHMFCTFRPFFSIQSSYFRFH